MKNEYVQSGMKKVGLTPMDIIVLDDFEGNKSIADGRHNEMKIWKLAVSRHLLV